MDNVDMWTMDSVQCDRESFVAELLFPKIPFFLKSFDVVVVIRLSSKEPQVRF